MGFLTSFERKFLSRFWTTFGPPEKCGGLGAKIYPLPKEGQRSGVIVISSSRASQSPPPPPPSIPSKINRSLFPGVHCLLGVTPQRALPVVSHASTGEHRRGKSRAWVPQTLATDGLGKASCGFRGLPTSFTKGCGWDSRPSARRCCVCPTGVPPTAAPALLHIQLSPRP